MYLPHSEHFTCDSFNAYNIWSCSDFTDEELDLITKRYGGNNRYSLEEYVESLPEREQEKYLYIPHVFLILDDLILDAASDMFDCKNSPDRYYDWDENPIID
jgi:hypothetical protein